MKKQIIFVEYTPTIISFKIARTLKLTGEYETVLVSFSKENEEFYKKAYDKIIWINAKHKLNPKNLFYLIKLWRSQEWKEFRGRINGLNPWLFQITGPDLFTMIFMISIRGKPKIYFAYDIWAFFSKKFRIKNTFLTFKEISQKIIEKICFRNSEGILHKGLKDELALLDYPVSKPDLAISPGCLDEWIFPPKSSKDKEIHLVYAGGPLANWEGRIPFLKVLREITSQKIHFHTYGKCVEAKEERVYSHESKINKFFHMHEGKTSLDLNKEMKKYQYGILLDFFDTSILNPLWPKSSMANKIFNYIEGGIPLIVNKQSKVMVDIVEKEKIGFTINYSDLKNLRKLIEKQDYSKLQKNVKKAQQKFKLSRIIQELEEFYDKIEMNVKKD